MNNSEKITFEAIATVNSPFKEKFAIPRQPGLAPSVVSKLIFAPEFAAPACFAGLEQFSHIWVIFLFHQNIDQGWQPKVRPPRLGGNDKIGVFASRSSFRPNGLGMSVAKLLRHYPIGEEYCIEVSGLDLVDGTPVFDIKPYIQYADSLTDAKSGFAQESPASMPVVFSPSAEEQLHRIKDKESVKQQLIEILQQDPRPAYKKKLSTDEKVYTVHFAQWDVSWQVQNDHVMVMAVKDLD